MKKEPEFSAVSGSLTNKKGEESGTRRNPLRIFQGLKTKGTVTFLRKNPKEINMLIIVAWQVRKKTVQLKV